MGQRGQTSAEYAGILAVVASVVVALGTSDIGDRVSAGVKQQICAIAGGECAAAPAPPATPAPEPVDAPVEGPPLDDYVEVPVLPFAGSGEYKCFLSTASRRGKRCKPGDGPRVGVRVKTSVKRSHDKLNAYGCSATALGVTGNFEQVTGAGGSGRRGGGAAEHYDGTSTSWEATVSPARADAIVAGDAEAPNPVDLDSLDVGDALELNERYYDGLGLSANFRGLGARGSAEEGRERSSGVRRISDDTVRLFVGDADYVKRGLGVGTANGKFDLQLGADSEMAQGDMRAIDVDVSTPEGREAYHAFVQTGRLPFTGTAGTENATTSQTWDEVEDSRIGAELGGLSAGFALGDSETHLMQTRAADGSSSTLFDSRVNDVGFQVVTERDADGNGIGEPTYGLNLNGVDQSLLDTFRANNGMPEGASDGTLRFEFSEDDLLAVQDQAVAQIQQTARDYGAEEPSREEILDAYQNAPPGEPPLWDGFPVNGPTAPMLEDLLAARQPQEVLVALHWNGQHDGTRTLENLRQFGLDTQYAVHGDDPVDVLPEDTRFPGTEVMPDCG